MPVLEHSDTLPNEPELVPNYLGPLGHASHQLDTLLTNTDPNQQLRAAVSLAFTAEQLLSHAQTEERQQAVTGLFKDVIAFAAEPDPSTSLLVRAEALEAGLQLLLGNHARDGTVHIPELETYRDRFEALIPNYFDNRVVHQANYSTVNPGPYSRQVGWMTRDFLRHEKLNKDIMFGDPYQDSNEPDAHSDRLPVGAFLLGDTLIQRQEPSFGYVGSEPTRYLVATALSKVGRILERDVTPDELREEFAPSKPLRPMLVAARLARLNRHGDYTENLEQLMDGVTETNPDYPEMMDALYEDVGKLKDVFPAAMASAVEAGARILTAGTTYGLVEHSHNNQQTKTVIHLHSGSELPVTLTENEPRELLDSLGRSVSLIHDAMTSETVRSVLSVDGNGFRIWRLIDLAHTLPPAVAVHLRAYGSESYDEQFEYGRPGEGVEATMGFVVDPTVTDPDGSPIRLGKKAYKKGEVDNRISIRLDREGVLPYHKNSETPADRDPTQEWGTVSLDLGSVLGPDASLGTRVGRFLAWSNEVKSKNHGLMNGLNHISHTFDDQLGKADYFAAAVHSLDARLQAMRISKAELRAYARSHAGKLALTNDQEPKEYAA